MMSSPTTRIRDRLDAVRDGLGSRLAALEMLFFPVPAAAAAHGSGAGARGSAGSSRATRLLRCRLCYSCGARPASCLSGSPRSRSPRPFSTRAPPHSRHRGAGLPCADLEGADQGDRPFKNLASASTTTRGASGSSWHWRTCSTSKTWSVSRRYQGFDRVLADQSLRARGRSPFRPRAARR
jgi:hypothetical protein